MLSALVIFNTDIPKKEPVWWRQFDVVIADKVLKQNLENLARSFKDLHELVDLVDMQKAANFANELSYVGFSGERITKSITYKGYELWWVHYSDLFLRFCLPYTQYKRLLEHLSNSSKVVLYFPPAPNLFQYFLEAQGSMCEVHGVSERKFPPASILLQTLISLLCLLWIKVRGPKLMVWTSDRLDPPHGYDFRMGYIYEELRKRNLTFIEFIRSGESWHTVVKRFIKRRRPVIYSHAIVILMHYLGELLGARNKSVNIERGRSSDMEPEEKFRFLVASHYLSNAAGTTWSIRALALIVRFITVKAAIINDGTSRNLHEVLACKTLGIGVVGIQHGVTMKHNLVSDFMPGFDGEKHLSVDRFGLWSQWWKEYYLKNSKAYKPEQLFVSGPMRPLQKNKNKTAFHDSQKKGKIKVLFISQLGISFQEVMPYLLSLVESSNLSVYLKARFNNDAFEHWLKKNHPDTLKNLTVLRGSMEEAIAECEVVVGSHSTGVLEALLQLKPFVCFNTAEWGDYFELKTSIHRHGLFAETQEELAEYVKKSTEIPKEVLRELQNRFFGDPYQNGSTWVVDQAENLIAEQAYLRSR